jgi:hypothetical protein
LLLLFVATFAVFAHFFGACAGGGSTAFGQKKPAPSKMVPVCQTIRLKGSQKNSYRMWWKRFFS